MKEFLALFDQDIRYAESLKRQLENTEGFPYAVRSFSKTEDLIAFLSSEEVPVLVLDRQGGGALNTSLNEAGSGAELVPYGTMRDLTVIYLTELQGIMKIDRHPAIGKYQPVSKIALQIMDAVRQERALPLKRSGPSGCRYTAVAGPVGRCGKTAFSLILGQLLSERGKSLYVGLEPFGALQPLTGTEAAHDLADFLYAFETGTGHEKYAALPDRFHDLDLVSPVRLSEDLYRTDPERIRNMIEDLAGEGHYEHVILDAGCDLRILEAFLCLTDRIYIPSKKDAASLKKCELFREWIGRTAGEDGPESEILYLPGQGRLFAGDHPADHFLWGDLGNYVRELLGED